MKDEPIPTLWGDVADERPKDWSRVCCGHTLGQGPPCCGRAGEYNGFGSDGPFLFVCPNHCSCHD